ncbi:unnamed protein product [Symbiodinium sp. CCMP2592]|nr:unnamed protein product [Symbiodinium sp. CCMP2592]
MLPESARDCAQSSWLWAVPGLGAFCGTATIAGVYRLAASQGHLPPGSTTPPISFLGLLEPEHTLYQIGFLVTGLLLASSVRLWSAVFAPLMTAAGFGQCAYYGWLGGCLASFGAASQGLVTLEQGILEKIASASSELSVQSKLHQAFALFFFMGCMLHCCTMTYAAFYCRSPAFSQLVGQTRWLKAVASATTFVAAPLAEALHPARDAGAKHQFDIAGLAQYLSVGMYIVFFGLYSLDFYQLRQASKPRAS